MKLTGRKLLPAVIVSWIRRTLEHLGRLIIIFRARHRSDAGQIRGESSRCNKKNVDAALLVGHHCSCRVGGSEVRSMPPYVPPESRIRYCYVQRK